MTHYNPASTRPVARATAFAAVVTIGALSMSAPAAASPVSTTTTDNIAVAGIVSEQIVATGLATAEIADAAVHLDPKTRKALTTATGALVRAQQLSSSTDLTPKQAKRIEAAADQVRELVATATVTADKDANRSVADALAARAERASRTGGRSPLPHGAGGSATTASSPVSVSAAGLSGAAANLSELLKKPARSAVSDVVPGPSKAEIAAARAQKAADRAEAKRAAAAKSAAAPGRHGGGSASRAGAAPVRDLSAVVQQYGNGQIPSDLLCGLSFSSDALRCDAAAAAEKLNAAFRAAFGRGLTVNDAYRSYEDQVTVAATHGALAAPPGTSNHGWGQALDLGGGISTFGSAEYNWMKAHAGDFGWNHPAWAEPTGSKPEAWHWEYGTPIG